MKYLVLLFSLYQTVVLFGSDQTIDFTYSDLNQNIPFVKKIKLTKKIKPLKIKQMRKNTKQGRLLKTLNPFTPQQQPAAEVEIQSKEEDLLKSFDLKIKQDDAHFLLQSQINEQTSILCSLQKQIFEQNAITNLLQKQIHEQTTLLHSSQNLIFKHNSMLYLLKDQISKQNARLHEFINFLKQNNTEPLLFQN